METKFEILEELRKITDTIILKAEEKYAQTPLDILEQKPSSTQWSAMECLEHLNLYGEFYIPEFQKFISNSDPDLSDKKFKPGLLGNYFANSMKVGQDGTVKNKMNTFRDKNPSNLQVQHDILKKFVNQQREFLHIINKSQQVDINRKGIPITITTLIKLKLGDALRFIVYHNERHIYQAENVLKELSLVEK